MAYFLDEQELIRFENYGEMFRDTLISLTGVNREFAKFHQSEMFPVNATFESEQVFKEARTKYLGLVKKLDAMALKISRALLFGEIDEKHDDVMIEINRLLIDIYRQRKRAKRTGNKLPANPFLSVGTIYGLGYYTSSWLPKIIHRMDWDEVVDTRAMDDKAREVGVLVQGQSYSKKRFYRWTRQNFNRFKMSRKNHAIKYAPPIPKKM